LLEYDLRLITGDDAWVDRDTIQCCRDRFLRNALCSRLLFEGFEPRIETDALALGSTSGSHQDGACREYNQEY
jgi:hypothetical protein